MDSFHTIIFLDNGILIYFKEQSQFYEMVPRISVNAVTQGFTITSLISTIFDESSPDFIVKLPNIQYEAVRRKKSYVSPDFGIDLDFTMLYLELLKQIFARFPANQFYIQFPQLECFIHMINDLLPLMDQLPLKVTFISYFTVLQKIRSSVVTWNDEYFDILIGNNQESYPLSSIPKQQREKAIFKHVSSLKIGQYVGMRMPPQYQINFGIEILLDGRRMYISEMLYIQILELAMKNTDKSLRDLLIIVQNIPFYDD